MPSNKTTKNERQSNPHDNHRERMRARFLSQISDLSAEGFSDHELLELLLFYAIGRRNTNNIAHALLDRFGSFDKVLDASHDELQLVDGIGSHSATLIKLLPTLFNRYSVSKQKSTTLKFTDIDMIGEYLISKYTAFTSETVFVLFLDDEGTLLGEKMLFQGSFSSCSIYFSDLASEIFIRRVPAFIVAHNHPNGICEPSLEDCRTTLKLKQFFDNCGVRFVDHLVVTHDSFKAILRDSIKYFIKNPNEL